MNDTPEMLAGLETAGEARKLREPRNGAPSGPLGGT
jgi:hypothetical protein